MSDNAVSNSIWKGYERYDFKVAGRDALVVAPGEPAPGRPWVWRAEFFDAYSYADMAMLEKGWHLVYYKVSNMYGCPKAIDLMHDFQNHVEREFMLAGKTVIFGFSRGGLYAFNYAAEYPEKVAALYLDAPVLDIRSWPGGKGAGKGGRKEWEQCLEIYHLTEETAQHFQGNPLNKADRVAKAGIPIIIVAGDSDSVVPHDENSVILEKLYRELGGDIRVILKPGVEHHPHSLENPEPIVEFLLDRWGHI